MYFRPPGAGGWGQPAGQPPGAFPNFNFPFQNFNPYLQQTDILLQHPNFPFIQSSNIPVQNPHTVVQNVNYPVQSPNLTSHQLPVSCVQQQDRPSSSNHKEDMERIDCAVVKARKDLIEAGESVSSWKVAETALVALQAESWNALGYRMQEVPSLHRLLVTEGKINAFIHCYVGARRITSVYDLEVAICKNEGVEHFEELEVGPLRHHPLVLHYFQLDSSIKSVYKITAEEIISHLCGYMDSHKSKYIKAEEFLDFIAKKQSVSCWEKLGVRIRNLGMHIAFVREARREENAILKKYLDTSKQTSTGRCKKRPLFPTEKKQFDEEFSAISHCKKSFSSAQEIFSGKHIRFISSCSEDDDDNDDGKTDPDNLCSNSRFSAQSLKSSDQVSSCPYPSQTEEIMRIRMMDDTRYEVDSDVGNRCGRFLKCTMDSGQGAECPYPSKIKEEARYRLDSRSSPASSSLECSAIRRPSKKIRKTENGKLSFSAPTPIKLPKKDKVNFTPAAVHNNGRRRKHSNLNEVDFSLATNSMRMFITTWKEACKVQNSTEVFERMLQFYKATTRQQKRIKSNFSLYPCIGLLNVAVMSIKLGMWDSIYDAFQAIDEYGLNEEFIECRMKDECIDVEPSAKDAEVGRKLQINIGSNSEHGHCVSIEDIMNKLATYFELDHEIMNGGKSSSGHKFVFLKKLLSCEAWLTEQLSIKEFKSLGYGEFFQFLEENASILPKKFFMCFSGEICEKSSLDVRMLQHQLVVLLSQASNNLWENESITKQKVSLLLKRQFPLIGLHIVETGFTEDILDILLKQGSNVPSKCVLFSATLCGTSPEELATYDSKEGLRTSEEGQKDGILGPVTSMDAIEVLLRAPMLSDLNSWSHWDLIFFPSLGPLVGWLLQEVNTKELLCVVTKDGSVIRLNHLATVASFLEASLQLSSFQAAVELISLFALFGGKKHSPLTLLKCHVRQAFEVALKNSEEDVKVSNSQNLHMVGKASFQVPIANKDAVLSLGHGLHGTFGITDRAVSDVSRFILDCLSYLPSEFCSFAADILLSGLRDVIKDAPSIILHECSKEQQLILHEVGLSLGIAEWIDDYHKFCSSSTADLSKLDCIPCCSSESCDLNIKGEKNLMDGLFSPERKMRASYKAEHVKESEVCQGINCMDVSGATFSDGCLYGSSELNGVKDAAFVIESIRREEFGLDPSLSMEESSMLSKQHARLGRALHCLSQELYSQDSHFLLELIQNADDNSYPDVVIPTLTFILHEEGIVVLNNERGFGAQNIRALCDVGNSTKKGSSTGYIGKKGIGFKSVFRVTDAPEIHSNGFHIKFDISEGQIGFVLPSFIPPCNIDLYSKLASSNTDEVVSNCWNTCIVLPFRSKLSEGICIKSIISMFSDLHPSLLLFLHRLKCITFRNMLNDSLVVMRKDLVGNGIVRVSLGSEHMTWFVSSQTLPANSIRSDVQTTEISIAFTLKETDNGEYTPHLELQPVFAFLPLRTYGLKFILQGDFVLPSSREEVDGDSPWNQWLLSEFPGLFVSAERSFCALPCYKENPGKAISIYMSFVPLVGEVHGFFSSLPRMIISKLRISHCFLVDEDNTTWVPPCKVLRNWNPQARTILSDDLLHTHLGLGFLDKDIFLSDSLARALGVVEYGPKVLVQVISSLSHTPKGLESVGFGWLFSCLNELYTMCSDSSVQNCFTSETELDIIWNLQKAPFIPLSDGTYGAADNGTIWLHTDALACEFDSRHGVEAFPNLYGKLQIVTPALFSASANTYQVDNVTRLLCRIGCQALSAHEIIKVHILPAFSKHQISDTDKSLMVEYLSFVMYHLQSNCPNCKTERSCIISDLKNKALILTNHGYQLLTEVPIHFTKEYGNPIDVNKLFDSVNLERHEIDISYIKHSVSNNLPSASAKWREFFQELGVTDFVKVVGVHKNILEISPTLLKNVMCGRDPISHVSLVRDWECNELAELLSLLSMNHYRDKCIHMLDVLDVLWDDYFSDKVMGCCSLKFSEDGIAFKSSFIRSICDVQWIASSMDDELHSPQYLFHDCDAVRSILGSLAPYAIPKVRSEKLLSAIGFRTQVTINDVLETLKAWRKLKKPFKASLVQMSRLYAIISNEMVTSRERILNELHSLSYIFVPLVSVSMQELSYGIFLSPNDVYWHDSTGSLDLIKGSDPYYDSVTGTHGLTSKMLCNLYPGLHDFFVGCGVPEIPHFRIYIKILLQLSSVCLPSQAAKAVFWIFVRWADGLRSGAADSENMVHLKESLSKSEFTVFPTERNKWASLDPSSGLLCWCNNETLRKEFENSNNIEFLSFGDLNDDEMELLQVKVSVLMQSLGIPAFSEVVTREAIYYGPADSSFKVSLMNWALPYLQRYMHHLHHDKYSSLKKSWFEILNTLQIIVVEKLFCRNVIAKAGAASNKRLECNSLLQGNILYTTQESDSHSLFMELSRLLFDGSPELPLANFLHMITTMVESGSSEAQTEFFILNTQKMPKLPGEESLWTLSFSPPSMEIKQQQIGPPLMINEQFHSRPKRKAWISDWPPADWKSAPDFNFTHAPFLHPSGRSGKKRVDSLNAEPTPEIPYQMDADWTIKDDTTGTDVGLVLPNTESMENQFAQDPIRADSSSADPVPNQDSIQAGNRDQLLVGEPNSEQAALTGRLGELLAYKYFARKGGRGVKWVNEISETGLPYDIVLEGATGKEYVEVKATKSRTKDWFMITAREWQFALEAGESFSIAHVVLSANNVASVAVLRNPAKLCQLGKLQLVVMMPKLKNEYSVVS